MRVARDYMDEASAVAEARRRWGDRGGISIADEFARSRCLVGELLPGPRFFVRGRGSSWEAAFADADARLDGGSRRHCPTAVPLFDLELSSS